MILERQIFVIIFLYFTNLCIAGKEPRWPYIGEHIPPYIGISAAYEGLKTNNFQAGIVVNVVNGLVTPPIGGMIGGGIFYKQNTTLSMVRSFEGEIGIYAGPVFGVNYNYNITSSNRVSGFKPFVGIAVYNVQVFYGYSFYNSKRDVNNELRHNRITIRYVIPVIRLKKKKSK